MVGSWPLAPHRDHLQYIHHVHLMQWGQNRGVTMIAGILKHDSPYLKDDSHELF